MQKNQSSKFIASAGLDNFGDGLMTIFFPLIMLSMTSDPIIFSLSYVIKTLSSVLSSFLSGYILDFHPILKVTKLAKMVRLLSLIIIILLPISIPLILLCALVFGATEVFIDNSTQTLSLNIYQKSELIKINNKLQSMEYSFAFFMGPIIGSFIFKPYDSSLLYLAFITYSLSLLFFYLMQDIPQKNIKTRNEPFEEMMKGLNFLSSHVSLRMLCIYAAAFCLVISSFFSVFPMIISSQVNDAPLYTGFFYALNSLGFVLSSSLTPKISRAISTKKMLFISLSLAFLSTLVIALNHTIYVMLLSVFLLGCGMGFWGCIAVTYRQKLIPEGIFSRTNAVYRLFSWGALCLGGLMGGAIYQVIGYGYLFYITLAFTLFLTISFYFIPLKDDF